MSPVPLRPVPPSVERVAFAADGARLAYSLFGAERAGPDAPRVVAIHSLALDRFMWEGVAAELAGEVTLLALDCRGHGASERPAGPYDLADFAADVAAVMDDAGWTSAVVAGCSMGGCVAQALAALYPARVRALVAIDTTAWYGPDAPAAWRTRADRARDEGLRALAEFQAERWFGDAFRASRPEVLERWLAVFANNDPDCYAAACAMLGDADLRPLLGRIAAPTLVVVGEEDYATPPAMAEALSAAIAGAELRVLAGTRHLTPIERPAEIAAAIRAALRATARRT